MTSKAICTSDNTIIASCCWLTHNHYGSKIVHRRTRRTACTLCTFVEEFHRLTIQRKREFLLGSEAAAMAVCKCCMHQCVLVITPADASPGNQQQPAAARAPTATSSSSSSNSHHPGAAMSIEIHYLCPARDGAGNGRIARPAWDYESARYTL